MPDPSVKVSQGAVSSVAAALLQDPKLRTDEERRYDEVVKSCVPKPCTHSQLPAPEGVSKRLYTVTTIAASARYGGTRTPVVCDDFEVAREIVERNAGDIFETSYRLAVIEAVVPNQLYGGTLDEQYWYRWDGPYETGRYVPVERPSAYEGTVGFGIG